jgi:predicted N-acetyltransferase YhbS
MDFGTSSMTLPQFVIRSQKPEDARAVSALHAKAFGPGRFARSAYRVREEASNDLDLCLTAWDGAELIGVIHFTRILVGGRDGALLLGPLAVDQRFHGQGWGMRLVREGMERGKTAGFQLVLLVGDPPYYVKAGFSAVPQGQILLPGPVDPARLLAAELSPGSLASYSGLIRGAPKPQSERP